VRADRAHRPAATGAAEWARLLLRHGQDGGAILFNARLSYRELALEAGDTVAVLGRGVREARAAEVDMANDRIAAPHRAACGSVDPPVIRC
jgi:hypothetical protein